MEDWQLPPPAVEAPRTKDGVQIMNWCPYPRRPSTAMRYPLYSSITHGIAYPLDTKETPGPSVINRSSQSEACFSPCPWDLLASSCRHMPCLWLGTVAGIFAEYSSLRVGKRELGLLCTASLFVSDSVSCCLVQITLPFEDLPKAQVLIFSPLPYPHPLPGVSEIGNNVLLAVWIPCLSLSSAKLACW